MAHPREPRKASPEWVMRGYFAVAVFLYQIHCDAIDDALAQWCEACRVRPL